MRLVVRAGIIAARVVKAEVAHDLALLKTEGRFAALPVVSSRGMRLAATGALPETVNDAVKSSFLLSFFESVSEVSAKVFADGHKDANTKERKFEDVVKSAEQAAVLVC